MNQKNFNNCRNLNGYDVKSLTAIIGKNCSQLTKDKISQALTYNSFNFPKYGIFERLIFENFDWRYIVGQDRTSEMKIIRNLILKGV